jgi:DNA invertase Pin-like site-specific DNA recombinase
MSLTNWYLSPFQANSTGQLESWRWVSVMLCSLLGASVYDPTDPMGKMFFNILATFAEFEVDLIRMRTREGMAIARAKGKLRGKRPKLSDKQQKELCRMHGTGEYSISDLAELFSVSRATVYRTLARHAPTGLTQGRAT